MAHLRDSFGNIEVYLIDDFDNLKRDKLDHHMSLPTNQRYDFLICSMEERNGREKRLMCLRGLLPKELGRNMARMEYAPEMVRVYGRPSQKSTSLEAQQIAAGATAGAM